MQRCLGLPALRLVLAGLAIFAIAGCQTDVGVVVEVQEDGSGTVSVAVTLDQDAAAALLDLDDEGLRLNDLFQAGWDIEPPEATSDGGVTTTALKGFGTPAQFAQIMNELSGSGSFFDSFELSREKAFSRVEYSVTGTMRPAGLDPFADADLETALGRTLTELASSYAASGSDVTVSLELRLPGSVDAQFSNGQVDPGSGDVARRLWTTQLDAPAPTEVRLGSSTQEVESLVWRGISVLAAVLAVLVLFGHVLRLVRPERRRGRNDGRSRDRERRSRSNATSTSSKQRDSDGATGSDGDNLAFAADDGDTNDDHPKVVALDGMGVLYREGDDINKILVPFVRERGSTVTQDEIAAKARSVSLGRITSSDFWTALAVPGDANEIDDAYLARFQLNPGVVKFLRSLRDRGVRVACVTNDGTAWANNLRARHSLQGLIDPWVVSGAVGVRKPDAPIYEVLRRVTAEDPADILVIDDDLDNLDAARDLGFRTAWFAPEAEADDARGHAILRSFDVPAAADEAGT